MSAHPQRPNNPGQHSTSATYCVGSHLRTSQDHTALTGAHFFVKTTRMRVSLLDPRQADCSNQFSHLSVRHRRDVAPLKMAQRGVAG